MGTKVEAMADGLWAAERRPLTAGLAATITMVAAEALAVNLGAMAEGVPVGAGTGRTSQRVAPVVACPRGR